MDVVSITLAKRMENSEQGAQFMHNKSFDKQVTFKCSFGFLLPVKTKISNVSIL